jgi:hypothetical protein
MHVAWLQLELTRRQTPYRSVQYVKGRFERIPVYDCT